MKFRFALVASVLVASLSASASAAEHEQQAQNKADPAKGGQLASTVCAACHGADGNSAVPANPKLAAQNRDYIAKQLHDFKSGARQNPIMQGMAAGLNDQQMQDVGAFFQTQRIQTGAATNKETAALGQQIYRAGVASKGVPACAGCHGAKGEGIPAQFPRLGGQHAQYIEAQLQAFRNPEEKQRRTNDPNKMMQTIAAKMSDAEIKAVADYIAGLH